LVRPSALFGSCVLLCAAAQGAAVNAIPGEAILVKAAWSSASDSLTPVPEGGELINNVYRNEYFELAFGLSRDWTQRFEGPPPSDSGYYVLAQIEPADPSQARGRGHILIAAQDMFFTLTPARNALELIDYFKDHLAIDYKVERAPTQVRIADHNFVRLDYVSPIAELHWHVLATEIRCHTVQFVFTGHDAESMERLMTKMNTMKLPMDGAAPLCIKDFASTENVIEREEPAFSEPRFNPVPVRIVIDVDGRVKHIHFLRAFPEQVKSISDALGRWRFRPYVSNGHPVEVETGIMFGRAPRSTASSIQ
jgi:hypothetical protein